MAGRTAAAASSSAGLAGASSHQSGKAAADGASWSLDASGDAAAQLSGWPSADAPGTSPLPRGVWPALVAPSRGRITAAGSASLLPTRSSVCAEALSTTGASALLSLPSEAAPRDAATTLAACILALWPSSGVSVSQLRNASNSLRGNEDSPPSSHSPRTASRCARGGTGGAGYCGASGTGMCCDCRPSLRSCAPCTRGQRCSPRHSHAKGGARALPRCRQFAPRAAATPASPGTTAEPECMGQSAAPLNAAKAWSELATR